MPSLEWLLTDRCGYSHTGARANVPPVALFGDASTKGNEIQSNMYGRVLYFKNGWARAHSLDGTLDIFGISTTLPSVTFSFFFKHLKPGTSEWGPTFTSYTSTAPGVTSRHRKVGVAIHDEAIPLHWGNSDCGEGTWSDYVPPNNYKWVHVTLVYNAAAKIAVRYINGEYHSAGHLQVIGCATFVQVYAFLNANTCVEKIHILLIKRY